MHYISSKRGHDAASHRGAREKGMRASIICYLILASAAPFLNVEASLAQTPSGQEPKGQALITGIGRMGCAHWLSSQSLNEDEAWILGFWSGLNHAKARTVGQHTDGEAIIAEVRKVCAARPSMPLADATFTAYSEMESTQVGQNVRPPAMLAQELSVEDRACITSATEKLPQATALKIEGSRAIGGRSLEQPQSQGRRQWSTYRVKVEIDVSVAGHRSTYVFNCIQSGQATVIQPLGMR